MDKNSLLYWYPKIKTLDIPIPKTEIVEVEDDPFYFSNFVEGNNNLEKYNVEIFKKAELIGFPLFMRTDLASGKHDWKNSCYVEKKEKLMKNLRGVIEFSFMAHIIGLSINAIVFREYIELEAEFTAFWGELPIAKERRYFIKDGDIQCHHPYWPHDAILRPSREDWEVILTQLNTESEEEVALLSDYAKRVASVLKGYWSVDFAHAKDGRWILIDMALGAESFHLKGCPFARKMEE